ncbi:hypothetical protein RCL_jg5582.t1 [Rhizophagus clarus]|uniref:Uncharacterized protein n=1 Tax=Rhizophagus clarus TaxID=94130 RepID=A0A8H3M127_9GLOM|nr:hypothetical protein RCL_jg5582.t1 [Rhizophagus clarus]
MMIFLRKVKSICDEILKSHRLCAYSEPPFNTSQNGRIRPFYTRSPPSNNLTYSEPQAYYFSDFFGGTTKHTTNGEEVVILFADALCKVNCIIIE